jgi:glycosyltransferase involved in cell wall biosynthesis
VNKYSNLNSTPLVSVCVAVKNRQDFLPICLKSITNQTYSNLEIIIVYTQSFDNTLKVINDFSSRDTRIKFIEFKSTCGNDLRDAVLVQELAYNSATGDYLCSVDSDDYIELNCIEECLNNINDCGLIYTYCRQFGNINLRDNRAKYTYSKEALLRYFMVFHFRLFKRDLWDLVKPFSDIQHCWDYDLVLKLSEVCDFKLLPRVLYNWRRHDHQMTCKDNIEVIKENMNKAVLEAKIRRGLI